MGGRVPGEKLPALALILRQPEMAAGGTHREGFAWLVDGQRMAQDEVIGMALRQSVAKNIEAFAAVGGAGDARARHRGECGIRP